MGEIPYVVFFFALILKKVLFVMILYYIFVLRIMNY
jgi:hypothetical protein